MLYKFYHSILNRKALIKLVDKFDLRLGELGNIEVPLSRFSKPIESISDPIPLLFQSGYLSIKDYNCEDALFTLSYQNKEVRVALAEQLLEYRTDDSYCRGNFLLSYTKFRRDDDIERFLLGFKAFLKGFPFSLDNSEKNEKHYHGLLYTALVSFGADVMAEKEQYLGKPDIILKMPNTIYILELKYEKSVNTAINQAKKKDYVGEFFDDKRPIKIVGINFLEDDENEIFSYEINQVK